MRSTREARQPRRLCPHA